MQAGQQEEREPHSEQTSQDQQANDESSQVESSLLDIATALVILVRETWRERWSLVKAEARLSLKSILLIVMLIFYMAMAVMLIWILSLGAMGAVAWQAGIHWGWIIGGAIVAQVGLIWYLRRQARRLIHWVGFPETRRAFSPLDPAVEEPTSEENAPSEQTSDRKEPDAS